MKRKQPNRARLRYLKGWKSEQEPRTRKRTKHYGELGGRHEQATGYKRKPKHKERQWNQDT